MPGIFNPERTIISVDSWADFRKLIDGTLLSASFNYENRTGFYRIVTEPIGGVQREYTLTKNNGADQTDFETNFVPLTRAALESRTPILIRPESLPTFYVTAANIATANNKSMFSILNASDANLVRIFSVQVINVRTATATGVISSFELRRITGHSGGTAVTAETADTADTLAGVTLRTNSTVAGESATLLRRFEWSTDEWAAGTLDLEAYEHIAQVFSQTLPRHHDRQKPVTLRGNQGLTVKCATNTPTGLFDIHVVFALEKV